MSFMEEIVYEEHTFSKIEEPTTVHVNSLVWLKQPDYPWWPGIVIPVESAGLTLPEDKDLCILCFPSNASTVAFGKSNDANEIRVFNGMRDADLISEGEKNAECAVAINEALNMYSSEQYVHANTNHNSELEEDNNNNEENESNNVLVVKEHKELELQMEENGSGVTNNNSDSILGNSQNEVNVVNAAKESEVISNFTEERATMIVKDNNKIADKYIDANVEQKESRHRHKRERTHRHHSENVESSKEDRSERYNHRHHRRHRHKKENPLDSTRSNKKHKAHGISKKMKNEEEEESLQQSSESSSEEEEESSSKERKHTYVMEKDDQARQSRLDEYEFEAQQPPEHYMRRKSHQRREAANDNGNTSYNEGEDDNENEENEEDDAQYYYRKCHESRTRVSNTFLETTGAELRRVIAICLNDSLFEEHEEVILSLLRPLTKCDVTLEQLQETHIGIIVGQLLMRSFTLRVNQLAHAILTYWFRSLPSSLQANFVEDNEIDRCSIDTTAGSRSSDAHPALGAVGVHIFESFTDEELDDTPPQIDVIELCKEFETVLQSGNDDHDTRVQVLSEIGSSKNGELRRALLDGKITVQEVIRNVNDLPRLLHRFHRNRLRRHTSALALRTSGLGNDDTDASHSPSSPFSPMMGESTSNLSESVASPTLRGGLGNITTMYTCPNCGAQEAYRTVYTVAAHDNFPDILRCKQCGTTWNISEQPS